MKQPGHTRSEIHYEFFAFTTFIVIALAIAACSGSSDDRSESIPFSNAIPDSLEVPNHIRSLENLTVYSPDTEPKYEISFEKVTTFKDDSGFGSPYNFAVDSAGRVYFVDSGMYGDQTIHVYNPQGDFITTMGRDGRGPGEFVTIDKIHIQSGRLYALDSQLMRINVFSLQSLEPLHTINFYNWNQYDELKGTQLSRYFYPGEDDKILMSFKVYNSIHSDTVKSEADVPYIFYWINREGKIASDRVFENVGMDFHSGAPPPPVPGGSFRSLFPFERSSLLAKGQDDILFTANTESFLIKKYDSGGNYLNAFYYPIEKQAFNPDGIPERRQDDLSNTTIPDTWPALNRMITDDKNRLWVSTITNEDHEFKWWVLDEDGELRAAFKWAGKRLKRHRAMQRINMIKAGYLYAFEPSGDGRFLGNIVKYRIRLRPENAPGEDASLQK